MATQHHTLGEQLGLHPPEPRHTDSAYPHYATAPPKSAQQTPPSHLTVQLAPLEPQPWAKDLWGWWAKNTVGIARVDLRRPTPPFPEQYHRNNLLFASYKQPNYSQQYTKLGGGHSTGWQFFGRSRGKGSAAPPLSAPLRPPTSAAPPAGSRWDHGKGGQHPPPGAPPSYYPTTPQGTPASSYYAPSVPPPGDIVLPEAARSSPPTGARVKITRNLHIWHPDDTQRTGKPLADLGGGLNIDMDRQRVDPVLRLKLGDMLSIKAFPVPMLKLAKTIPLAKTGMGLKVLYEVPFEQIHHFYRPPARLMVRLDQMPGTGIKLSPAGIEMDQTAIRFGKNLRVRASAGLAFPRTLPLDPDNDEFGLKVHRLSLKALW